MSRVAKRPICVPEHVNVELYDQDITVTGNKGILKYSINKKVEILYKDRKLFFKGHTKYSDSWIQAGTSRSLINSMIIGVSEGFSKKLYLSGVGYKVILKNTNLIYLHLGFSHLIKYEVPDGVLIKIPSPTELILSSANKQLLGQVAANLRAYKIPEPYKGKGIRYENEVIRMKEAKKK